MATLRFQGKIDHTEKTIQRLYKTQFYAYAKLYSLIRIGIGVIMILIGALATLPTWLRAILLLIGAWLVVSRDFPAQIQADRALQERKAVLPAMRYVFTDNHVTVSGEGSMDIPYQKFTRLVQDPEYLYLFVSRNSVCMMERATLKPQPDKDFMKFIEEKTGLTWRQERSFLSMNLVDLVEMFRDRKRK